MGLNSVPVSSTSFFWRGESTEEPVSAGFHGSKQDGVTLFLRDNLVGHKIVCESFGILFLPTPWRRSQSKGSATS